MQAIVYELVLGVSGMQFRAIRISKRPKFVRLYLFVNDFVIKTIQILDFEMKLQNDETKKMFSMFSRKMREFEK